MSYLIQIQKNYTEKPDTSMFNMHTHNNYEIFCFLSGDANYYIEGTIYNLKPNDILIINKLEAHSLLIKSTAPYKRIVINFDSDSLLIDDKNKLLKFINDKPLGINNHYPSSIFHSKNWIYYLEKICGSDDINVQRMYLTVLINELSESQKEITQKYSQHTETNSILKYINDNLTNNISLEKICDKFHFSKTHLNRKFKTVVGTTIWEYIITKRLHLAKELLKNGAHPTSVYLNCGFNDYCTFYKGYKNKFGVSPKDDFIKVKNYNK